MHRERAHMRIAIGVRENKRDLWLEREREGVRTSGTYGQKNTTGRSKSYEREGEREGLTVKKNTTGGSERE